MYFIFVQLMNIGDIKSQQRYTTNDTIFFIETKISWTTDFQKWWCELATKSMWFDPLDYLIPEIRIICVISEKEPQ